jgi:hypothetical protein
MDDPPPGASMEPLPETDTPPRNTREEIELLTSPPLCTGCHSDINPPGFTFEGFDAVGMARTMENGVPVNTAADFVLDGVPAQFQNAAELVEALAASPEAHACYVGNYIQFGFGRRLSAEDEPTRRTLSVAPLGARALVAELSTTPAFMKRLPNEVGP